jgi:hypothetical protein
MPIELQFKADPLRVEMAASGKLLARDMPAAYRRAFDDPKWRKGMRALWRVPASVDLSDIDMAAIEADIVPAMPALNERWGDAFKAAWVFEGPLNATIFDLWVLMPAAPNVRRFDNEADALAWLTEP